MLEGLEAATHRQAAAQYGSGPRACEPGHSSADLKTRCEQLISMYERYGSGRNENSDGVRNHRDWGARVDCENGRAAMGIADMEDLLRRKEFDV